MKKYFVFLCVIAAFISCTGPQGPKGDKGDKGDPGVVTQIVNVTVPANAWTYTNYTDNSGQPYANNYFYSTIQMPEITESVFDYGSVAAYVVYNRTTTDASQHLLPYTRHYEEQRSDGTWNYYTETIDCTYGIGWIEFNYRASDFAYEDDTSINPLEMDFRVVVSQ